jgi:hypothetical protein
VKKDTYDPFLALMEKKTRNRLKFLASEMKGIWRCVEKIELRQDPVESCESICNNRSRYPVLEQRFRTHGRLPAINGCTECSDCVREESIEAREWRTARSHAKIVLKKNYMGVNKNYSFFRSALELLETTDDCHKRTPLSICTTNAMGKGG